MVQKLLTIFLFFLAISSNAQNSYSFYGDTKEIDSCTSFIPKNGKVPTNIDSVTCAEKYFQRYAAYYGQPVDIIMLKRELSSNPFIDSNSLMAMLSIECDRILQAAHKDNSSSPHFNDILTELNNTVSNELKKQYDSLKVFYETIMYFLSPRNDQNFNDSALASIINGYDSILTTIPQRMDTLDLSMNGSKPFRDNIYILPKIPKMNSHKLNDTLSQTKDILKDTTTLNATRKCTIFYKNSDRTILEVDNTDSIAISNWTLAKSDTVKMIFENDSIKIFNNMLKSTCLYALKIEEKIPQVVDIQ